MEVDDITKKLLNKIIWMPYHRAWRLFFLCSILITVCSGAILFPSCGYPIYDDCIEYEGIVEKFEKKKNQTNIYYSLELQNGKMFYINEPLMEVLDLSGAFKEIKPGDYIEILSLNEKDGAYGPRVMALKKDGQSYLTYEQSKSVYQNIETDSRKWIMMVLSILVLILLYLSAIHVVQLLFIRKIGKPIVINEQRKGIFHFFQTFVPCLLIILAVIFIAGALNRYEDWKAKMDFPLERDCASMNGTIQKIEIQEKGKTIRILLDDGNVCYAEKDIIGDLSILLLMDADKGTCVEFLVHSFEEKNEQKPYIVAFTEQSNSRITYQQGKDFYLFEEIKESKEISLWYLGATISCLLVSVPILLQRKKEGARPNP